MSSRRRPIALAAGEAPAALAAGPSGVEVIDGKLEVTDWGAWLTWVPGAIADAIAGGARYASAVMVEVMRRALPEYAWPPHEGDSRYPSWRETVDVVARRMNLEPDPQPVRTPLRVVQ
jgi:hypothetical protein